MILIQKEEEEDREDVKEDTVGHDEIDKNNQFEQNIIRENVKEAERMRHHRSSSEIDQVMMIMVCVC